MTALEVRPFVQPVEVRSEGGKLILAGAAIGYGRRSRDLGGFRERIMPGAAKKVIKSDDVMALDEHRSDRYLGRLSNGTLRLEDAGDELRYEIELPDTAVGREVAHLAERGDYKGSSFGFRAGEVKWSKDEDGTPLRSIHSLSLLRDVGPTISPAYDATSAEMVLRQFPSEAERDVEVRSVLEAASRGQLGDLLDGIVEPPVVQVPPRRPAHWFV